MYVRGLFYLFFVRVPIGSCLQILDGLFSLKEAKIFDNYMLHQTPERVFHPISKHTEVGVWKLGETQNLSFDVASQTIDNSWRKSKHMFTKFCDNFPNSPSWFCILFMEW